MAMPDGPDRVTGSLESGERQTRGRRDENPRRLPPCCQGDSCTPFTSSRIPALPRPRLTCSEPPPDSPSSPFALPRLGLRGPAARSLIAAALHSTATCISKRAGSCLRLVDSHSTATHATCVTSPLRPPWPTRATTTRRRSAASPAHATSTLPCTLHSLRMTRSPTRPSPPQVPPPPHKVRGLPARTARRPVRHLYRSRQRHPVHLLAPGQEARSPGGQGKEPRGPLRRV